MNTIGTSSAREGTPSRTRIGDELDTAPQLTGATRRRGHSPGLDRRAGLAASRGHIGGILAGSLAAGLVAAALLVAGPFVPGTEAGITGAVLCGWALGWALLAVLSERTDQPQRWAAAPALFMGVSGLLLVAFGSSVLEPLSWVWPPVVLALAIWMLRRAHHQLDGPSRRWVLYPVLAMLALASVGGGYQTLREATGASSGAMPGQLIDVGGHSLHLSCTGSGSPTVLLEPGAGAMSSTLGLITPVVARDTRVCVYDRAGRGWSEPAETTQDATGIATDLHTLLHQAQVPGPYVLAGHSFGGLYALTFAARYPDEVAGMVLVDSTAPASGASRTGAPPREGGSADLTDRLATLVSTSARLGLGRLIGTPTASHLRSTIVEYAVAASSTQQAASLRDLADRPLVVLTAGLGLDAEKSAAQKDLATLSTDSAHRVIEGVDHPGMVVDEKGAAATTRAILDVVSSVRTALPLTS